MLMDCSYVKSSGRIPLSFKLMGVVLFLMIIFTGCIRVRHLGSNTGDAYYEVFQAQANSRQLPDHQRPKVMEAELGERASQLLMVEKKGQQTVSRSSSISEKIDMEIE